MIRDDFQLVRMHADTRELFNTVLFIYGFLSLYTIRKLWVTGFVEIIELKLTEGNIQFGVK